MFARRWEGEEIAKSGEGGISDMSSEKIRTLARGKKRNEKRSDPY
jgi:hypothetical protein